MTDRFKRFARDWTLVGLSSKRKLYRTATFGRMLHAIIRGIMEEFGEDAVDSIARACYQVGLEEGENLAEKFNTGEPGPKRLLSAVETTALLNSVTPDTAEDEEGAILAADQCLYGSLHEDLPGLADIVCTSYTMGLIEALTNEDDEETVEITFPKLRCQGDKVCEVLVRKQS